MFKTNANKNLSASTSTASATAASLLSSSMFVILVVFTVLLNSFPQADGLECGSLQFKCLDGKRCITKSWKCDEDADCDDHSDEFNCTTRACSAQEFTCSNKRCLLDRFVCDGTDDCGDNSDEERQMCSTRTCGADQFTCHKSGKCIKKSWQCDGDTDCPDGSDESKDNCKDIGCSDGEFTCRNGKCITHLWRCDHEDDCGDRSDEFNCPNATCAPNEFSCSDGKCIADRFRCDGDSDCSDGSDELECPLSTKRPSWGVECDERQWKCLEGTCIHINWRCDGSPDCRDGSDEKNCTRTCRADQWQCKISGDCIPDTMRCNGDVECRDETDELDCPERTTLPTTTTTRRNPDGGVQVECGKNEFRCSPSRCVEMDKVCDGSNDCGDWSDEPKDKCHINECLLSAHGCSQKCVDDLLGFHCECEKGFRLAANDSRICEDINECLEPGQCSGHICLNTKGHFKCQCYEGYDLKDYSHCKAKDDTKPFIIFTNRHDIRNVSLYKHNSHPHYKSLYRDFKSAVALDFNLEKNFIVFSDVNERSIYIAPLNQSRPTLANNKENATILISKGIEQVDGLAVDWIHDLLYFTDTGSKSISLTTINRNAQENVKQIVTVDLEEPRGIVVNVFESFIVWTDWGSKAKIERALPDGSQRRILVDRNLIWPNGLQIDHVLKRIYWTDAKMHSIFSVDFNGKERQTILYSPEFIQHVFAIDLFDDHMYWSDWELESILKAPKFPASPSSVGHKRKSDVEQLLKGISSVMDLKIVHPYKQKNTRNRCAPMKCSHICVPLGKSISKCICPGNQMRLEDDKSTCFIPSSKTTSTTTSTTTVSTTRTRSTTTTTTTTAKPSTSTSTESSERDKNRVKHRLEALGASDEQRREKTSSGGVAYYVFVLFCAVLLGLLLVAVVIFLRNFYQRRNVTSMNFDNPVYRKTTEEQFSLDNKQLDSACSSLPSSLEPLTSPGTNEYV